jgi:hypothetical protein
MLKPKSDLPDTELAAGSSPSLPASSVMAALIAEQAEPRALCAFVASSIVSNASSTCGSRSAIAAAFADLASCSEDAVVAMLRGRENKTC